MRVRFSFILDIDNDQHLCRLQEVAHEVGAGLDCELMAYERDLLACVEAVPEDATK